MRTKQLTFETTESGCVVSTSHKLNQDGYLRLRTGSGAGRSELEMYHRTVWKNHHGHIPEGHEVDHKCRNRACSNIEHLQVLDRTTHLVKTNKERYSGRKESAKIHWETTGCTGTMLAEVFGVSFSAACGWIREWKV